MKFLLDVCAASRSLHTMLLEEGHDVLSAIAVDPSASDAALLQIAAAQRRVVITEDKDFGELVFVQRQPHAGIIRFSGLTVFEKSQAMQQLLNQYSTELRDRRIIVVSRNRIRVRSSD